MFTFESICLKTRELKKSFTPLYFTAFKLKFHFGARNYYLVFSDHFHLFQAFSSDFLAVCIVTNIQVRFTYVFTVSSGLGVATELFEYFLTMLCPVATADCN